MIWYDTCIKKIFHQEKCIKKDICMCIYIYWKSIKKLYSDCIKIDSICYVIKNKIKKKQNMLKKSTTNTIGKKKKARQTPLQPKENCKQTY